MRSFNSMTQIQFNLMNFPFGEQLSALFGGYRMTTGIHPKEYSVGLLRHNALNVEPSWTKVARTPTPSHTKPWLGIVKIASALVLSVIKM